MTESDRKAAKLLQDCAESIFRDAERYRWLRNESLQVQITGPIVCMADAWGTLNKDDRDEPVRLDLKNLDETIDAAMAVAAERDGRSKC